MTTTWCYFFLTICSCLSFVRQIAIVQVRVYDPVVYDLKLCKSSKLHSNSIKNEFERKQPYLFSTNLCSESIDNFMLKSKTFFRWYSDFCFLTEFVVTLFPWLQWLSWTLLFKPSRSGVKSQALKKLRISVLNRS